MTGQPECFIIMIDALRHDYISPDQTPFLYHLKMQGRSARVIETFAFQSQPAYFAGLAPRESDICHRFKLDPDTSPFDLAPGWFRLFGACEKIGLKKVSRSVLSRLARRKERSYGFEASAQILATKEIPLDLLPYFAPAERRYTDDPGVFGARKTIFDILREQGRSWNWIGYPRHAGDTAAVLKEFRSSPEAHVMYLHFTELDGIGHKYGPESPQLKAALCELDGVMRELLAPALAVGSRVIIFGDHGMVPVQHNIDLESALKELPFNCPKDYLYFLDSSQARFWFFNPAARQEIVNLLNGAKYGHILSRAEQKSLGIDFPHNQYGDIIFMLDGGYQIHPSFFARNDAPLGMHGYLPEVQANMSALIIHDARRPADDLGTVPMPYLYDLFLEAVL